MAVQLTEPELAAQKLIDDGAPIDPQVAVELARALNRAEKFGLERRLLDAYFDRLTPDAQIEPSFELAHGHALSTYKDPDLPALERLERAEKILAPLLARGTAQGATVTESRKTLALAGAIQKRKWEVTAQSADLERAYGYYRRAFDLFDPTEDCFTGINAAYALDLLAAVEAKAGEEAGRHSEFAKARRKEAEKIRRKILEILKDRVAVALEREPPAGGDYFILVTVSEAHFGLGEYTEATPYLEAAAGIPVDGWVRESSARQLTALACLRDDLPSLDSGEPNAARKALEVFLGEKAYAVETITAGKVGLALSGGGFRASLFHLGVLARLAELDVLRHVEALSCVSGGSIVGAYYYLELVRRLRDTEDGKIDYIDLVQTVQRQFLTGVQQNIRTRIAAGFWTNLKMLFKPHYSRTNRAGELYESLLYSRIADGRGAEPRYVDDILVQPRGEPAGFNPKKDNWDRRDKVPMLVLNATSLNTGHNWQFTGSWMGESPAGIDTQIDGNYRLRRMYYGNAPEAYRRDGHGHTSVRLGTAVGASACVPGLFEPISLPGLYEHGTQEGIDGGKSSGSGGSITVKLVDGGVHDNQGIVSLLEQDCTVLLVSDASGHQTASDDPPSGMIAVPIRTDGLMMARIRQAQFHEMDARFRAGQLRGTMFLHLKKGLDVDPVDWVGSRDKRSEDQNISAPNTEYGVPKEMQRRLASVRTDLDSFHDAEAYALMASGYMQTAQAFGQGISSFPREPSHRGTFDFLDLVPILCGEQGCDRAQAELARLLDASKGAALKVWGLVPALARAMRLTGMVLGGLFFLFLAWVTICPSPTVHAIRAWPLVTLGVVVPALFLIVLVAIAGMFGPRLAKLVKITETVVDIRKALSERLILIGFSTIGWIIARIHLQFFDPIYLKLGSMARLRDLCDPHSVAVVRDAGKQAVAK